MTAPVAPPVIEVPKAGAWPAFGWFLHKLRKMIHGKKLFFCLIRSLIAREKSLCI